MGKKKAKKLEEWDDEDDSLTNKEDVGNSSNQQESLGGLMDQIGKKSKKKKMSFKILKENDRSDVDLDVGVTENLNGSDGGSDGGLAVRVARNDDNDNDKDLRQETIPNKPKKDQDEQPGRIKSKKEKEKERKERQKLQAKQQAAKKKSTATVLKAEDPSEVVEVQPKVLPDTTQDLPKQKGKKGKPSAAIQALRNQVLLKKKLEEEEERLRREEEDRLRVEEERLKREEEEREEARLKRKEKEKAKKEQLKKEGKYLTPAQKAQQQAQKEKLQALLQSGVVVKGLEETASVKKRVVYDNKKKKKGQDKQTSQPTDTTSTEPLPATKEEKSQVSEPTEELKDSWDQSSQSEKEEDVKEDWEMSSSEDEVLEAKKVEKPVKEKVVEGKAKHVKAEGKSKQVKVEGKSATVFDDKPVKGGPTKSISDTGSKSIPSGSSKIVKAPPSAPESEPKDETEEESEDDSEEDSSDDSSEEMTAAELQALERKEAARLRRQERIKQSFASRSKDNLRSPIGVIMGHVDTGKTKLLDKIRQTNVQEGEAGGITQQIGATYFPIEAIEEKTSMIHKGSPSGYKLPGLLMIDTPGHESFTNLRSRGSSLCNIAVLVVDIVHGLEPQTIESLNMLKKRKTPFIVALNKIDRLFDWKAYPDYPTRDTLALQKPSVLSEFEDRVQKTIVAFAEQGLNACLYWENKNMGKNVSLVPTSAVTGEGVPDLLHLLMDLTQNRMTESLMYLSELECTVLEVKVIEGLGTTIDVVLSNGVLNEGDKIVVCGLNGPIVTNIRALLTPQPMRELRVKSAYQHHKTVKASLGIKISAPDLEKAIAGSRLLVCGPDDDEDDLMEEVMGDLSNLMESIDKSGKGVCVQASTLGSLEALLSFLKDMKIPVSGINIGPVHKKDIIRASVMLERCKEYAQLLAFDVPIEREAEQMAADMGVQIFSANIIYHLFDKYTKYMKELEEQKRKDAMPTAVFPCVLRMVPDAIFNKRSPIIIGVDVLEGSLKIGTPLCVVNKETQQTISLGKVVGIELNHKPRTEVKKGDPAVAIRIEMPSYNTAPTYGRHFVQEDDLYSKISRESIDVLKTMFRDKMGKEDWALVVKLKKILNIQ